MPPGPAPTGASGSSRRASDRSTSGDGASERGRSGSGSSGSSRSGSSRSGSGPSGSGPSGGGTPGSGPAGRARAGAQMSTGDLSAVGVDPYDERVYRALLARPASSPAEVAADLGDPTDPVDQALARLRGLGLVSRLSGRGKRYTSVEPDAAIEALVRARTAELERVRTTSVALSAVFHAAQQADGQAGPIRVLNGPAELGRWFVRLQHQVREEMLALDRPPYALAATNPVELDSLARGGVTWRAIYSSAALEIDGALDEITELADSGEQARVLPTLPMKLAIADRRIALLPLSFDLATTQVALIRESTLLDGLIALFENLWQQAVPLGRTEPDPVLGADDQAMITLMAAGLTDTAIARQLGWSIRTMRRRTAGLFESLSAGNRFQAGVQAALRGWLADRT